MIRQETTFDRIAELGRRFKQYRKAVGLTQHDLHYNTGVALSTISLFENGKGQGLSLAHFYLLMDALDLETSPEMLIPQVHRSNLAKLWERQNKRRKQ